MNAVLVGCIVLVASCRGAAADPILWPCQSGDFGYEPGVERTIGNALGAEPELSVSIYPSFVPEWGIALVRDGEEPSVVLTQFTSSYWASGWVRIDEQDATNSTPRHRPVVTKWSNEQDQLPERWAWDADVAHASVSMARTPVSAALAARLREVWDAAMAGIGPRDMTSMGVDGVSYQFQVGVHSCGATWSPRKEAIPGKLVSLVEQLRLLVQSPAKPDASLREKNALAAAWEFLKAFDGRAQAP